MKEIKQSVSGFKVSGEWGDVVILGEMITSALQELDATGEDFDEWEEWRPKLDDRLDDDINERTCEQASIDKNNLEKQDQMPTDELQSAGEELEEAYEGISEKDEKQAVNRLKDAITRTTFAIATASRQTLRRVEETVYAHVMTQIAPYYFDNELVSASITEKTTLRRKETTFILEVNINDDMLKQEVSDILDEYEDIDRWHADTPKSVEGAKEIHGHNV